MTERTVRVYPMPGFGKTLRDARLAKGMTQSDVAEMVGVRKGLVSLWEREKNWLSDAKLARICEVLDIDAPLPERNAKGRRSQGRANCVKCGKSFPQFHNEQYCSRACAYKAASERPSYNWKGGKKATTAGYVELYLPDNEMANGRGYVLEHRLVMSEQLGRPLTKNESVHHKNGDRADNRPENLELWVSEKPSNHRGARVTDLMMQELREEIRKIVREELQTLLGKRDF